MKGRWKIVALASLLSGLMVPAGYAGKQEGADRDEVQFAVEKGLFFVEKTTIRWWKKKKCSSCHEGPMLLFSHNIAKRRGFPIDQETLDFWTEKWVLTDGLVHDRKSDGRKDAGGMLGAPLTMFYRDTDADTQGKRAKMLGRLMQIAGKDWQHEDGSWDIAKVGLDYTPWIALALESYQESEMPLEEAVRDEVTRRRAKTEKWIETTDRPMPEKTEDLAAWLVYENHRGNTVREETLIAELLDRRRGDGMWGIARDSEFEHQLVTAAVLFSLTSMGKTTEDPLVAEIQRILLDLQQEDGRWKEGGRIFDDGAEVDNSVYNMWTTAMACAALAQTIELPPGTGPLFEPDPELAREIDAVGRDAAKGYVGTTAATTKPNKIMEKMEQGLASRE